jgi:hypothetical protein
MLWLPLLALAGSAQGEPYEVGRKDHGTDAGMCAHSRSSGSDDIVSYVGDDLVCTKCQVMLSHRTVCALHPYHRAPPHRCEHNCARCTLPAAIPLRPHALPLPHPLNLYTSTPSFCRVRPQSKDIPAELVLSAQHIQNTLLLPAYSP